MQGASAASLQMQGWATKQAEVDPPKISPSVQQQQQLSTYLDEEAEGRHQGKAACSRVGREERGRLTAMPPLKRNSADATNATHTPAQGSLLQILK